MTALLTNWKLVLVGVVLAGLVSAVGVQTVRLAGVRTALSIEQRDRAQETNGRLRAALRESERVASLQLVHATNQQEIVDAYEARLKNVQDGHTADVADAVRLRRQLAAFAAGDREVARSDPAACERVSNRSTVLADVAAEGRDLLAEGRRIVQARDAEVMLLRGLLQNDRAATVLGSSSQRSGSEP